MNIVYARQPLPKSIFLAGPTPRDLAVASWRPEAIRLLKNIGFDGYVFVPEAEDWQPHDDYDGQIEWEWAGIERASTVLFWIPRHLIDMPAFTTNVEFGLTVASQKILLGFPPDAPKCKYLKALAERYSVPVFSTLEDIVRAAVSRT
jgi:hypothetical protein